MQQKFRTQISCMQRKRTNATSKNPRNHSDSSVITDQAALVKVCRDIHNTLGNVPKPRHVDGARRVQHAIAQVTFVSEVSK